MFRNARRSATLFAAALICGGIALTTTACTAAPSEADFVGTWGEDASEQPSLTIQDDGKFAGTDGCNRLMGSYTVTDGVIDFGQTASTMMFCEGVDTWLSKLQTATISGSTLEVSDKSGTVIGSLAKQ